MKIHKKVRESHSLRLLASLILWSYISKRTWGVICRIQDRKGLDKYGHSIDDCPKEKFDWKVMAIEEIVDFFVYREKAKQL